MWSELLAKCPLFPGGHWLNIEWPKALTNTLWIGALFCRNTSDWVRWKRLCVPGALRLNILFRSSESDDLTLYTRVDGETTGQQFQVLMSTVCTVEMVVSRPTDVISVFRVQRCWEEKQDILTTEIIMYQILWFPWLTLRLTYQNSKVLLEVLDLKI